MSEVAWNDDSLRMGKPTPPCQGWYTGATVRSTPHPGCWLVTPWMTFYIDVYWRCICKAKRHETWRRAQFHRFQVLIIVVHVSTALSFLQTLPTNPRDGFHTTSTPNNQSQTDSYGWWFRNPANQLRLLVFPTIFCGWFDTSQVVSRFLLPVSHDRGTSQTSMMAPLPLPRRCCFFGKELW